MWGATVLESSTRPCVFGGMSSSGTIRTGGIAHRVAPREKTRPCRGLQNRGTLHGRLPLTTKERLHPVASIRVTLRSLETFVEIFQKRTCPRKLSQLVVRQAISGRRPVARVDAAFMEKVGEPDASAVPADSLCYTTQTRELDRIRGHHTSTPHSTSCSRF